MASDFIKLSTVELEQASTQFQQHLEELDNRLKTMQTQMSNLESSWSGQAQQAFLTLMGRWTQDYQGMMTVLGQVQQMLHWAGGTFGQVDADAMNKFNQIMNG